MTDAILEITDGTTTISLINKSSGFHMVRWTPGITDYKGGGVFTNPPLADWRQLRVGKWDTVQEQFGLTIDAANPNGAAYMLQELRRMLEKANAYWTTDWQNDPVYLVAKGNCETETRYCLVVKGRLANDQNYYQQPFTGRKSTMQSLPLIIERRAWLESAPGTRTAVPISNEVVYDGRTLGRAATTADEVFHANKRTIANITNVHINTGANLMNAAPPYTILNVSGTNSTYFGIDTSVADSGPFDSLVFDIGQAQVGATVVWEYWNGSAWTSLTTDDNTSQFTIAGVNNVSWVQPSNWVAASPGGALPVGYYVRARVTVTGSQNATQQNRLVYSQTVPYMQIEAAQIPGDIPALARLTVENVAVSLFGTSEPTIFSFGLRSNGRGVVGFTPYINLSDEQNPSGISVVATDGFATGSQYPTGRAARIPIAGADTQVNQSIFNISINQTISAEYYGTYHGYIRFASLSNISSMSVRAVVVIGSSILYDTGHHSPADLTDTFIDLGQVGIAADASRVNPGTIVINGDVSYVSTGATNIDFIDLILIPTDEWAADLQADLLGTRYIDGSSIDNPKRMLEVIIRNKSNDQRSEIGTSVNNGPIILQANSQQRLYSFAHSKTDLPAGVDVAPAALLKRGQIWRNSRYLSLRGER